MIRNTVRLVMSLAGAIALALAVNHPAQAQLNTNKVFASGSITGPDTSEPLTGINIPNKTLFQVQVYKNQYGAYVGRISYTDASFNMISSGRVKVLGLTSTQAKLLFVVTYKTSSDLMYVTLNRTVSSLGIVTNSATFSCTDYFGKVYTEFGRSAAMDPAGTLVIAP